MKRILIAVALAAALTAGSGHIARSDSMAAHTMDQSGSTVNVVIDNYAFKAPSLTVSVGTTVLFKNLDDDPHTVTSSDGLFDSKGLGQGDTWTHRFSKAGTYHYYCKVHPFMRGAIIVKEKVS